MWISPTLDSRRGTRGLVVGGRIFVGFSRAILLALCVAALAVGVLQVLGNAFGMPDFDEVQISHALWLLARGYRPGIEVTPGYLPDFLNFLLIFTDFEGVTALLTLRASAFAALVGSLLCFYCLCNRIRHRLQEAVGGGVPRVHGCLWALVVAVPALLFLALQRGTEFRPEPYGLLLCLAAWIWLDSAVLSTAGGRLKQHLGMAGGAVILAAATMLSLRAAFLGSGLLLAYGYLAGRPSAGRVVAHLCVAATAGVATLAALWVASGTHPLAFLGNVSNANLYTGFSFVSKAFSVRPQELVRPTQVLVLAVSAVSLWWIVRQSRSGNPPWRVLSDWLVPVVAGAVFAWVGILLDPRPFAYAYLYSGAALGIAFVTLIVASCGPGLFGAPTMKKRTACVLALCLLLVGTGPIVGDKVHAALRDGIRLAQWTKGLEASRAEARAASLPNLIAGLRPRSTTYGTLLTAVADREEICRRLAGEKVIASGAWHPICLPDLGYYWIPQHWMFLWPQPVSEDASARPFRIPELMHADPPALFIPLPDRYPHAIDYKTMLGEEFLDRAYVRYPWGWLRRDLVPEGAAEESAGG